MSDQDIKTLTITGKDGVQMTFVAIPNAEITIGEADIFLDETQRAELLGNAENAENMVIPEHLNQPVVVPSFPPSMIVNPALVDALVEALRPVIADEIERALIRFHTDKGDQ